jgi:hypothetical protein
MKRQEVGENCIVRSFITCTLLQIIIRMIKSRRMRWAGNVARMGEKMNAYRIMVGKPEGKRSLGRPTCRWVDNIKMDLREIFICEFLVLCPNFELKPLLLLSCYQV